MTRQVNKPYALSGKKLELLNDLFAQEGVDQEAPIRRRANLLAYPLSSGQQRLWFLDRLESGIHYNDHFNLRLKGPLHIDALERAIEEILRRHEALRSIF